MRSGYATAYFSTLLALEIQINWEEHYCKKNFEFLPIFLISVKNLPDFWKNGKSVKYIKFFYAVL
jgi:hypothetical protein